MNFLQEFINYTTNNINQILSLFMDHIRLTALAVIIAILIGVPVGILISYYKKLVSQLLVWQTSSKQSQVWPY